MTLYLDTSAVVKLYAIEPGAAEVRRELARADQLVSSMLTYVETRSALARKYHSREIAAARFEDGKAAFEDDWRIFDKVPPDSGIVLRAGDLAERFRIRAYDAVHLATAERVFRETQSQVRFVCFDVALNRAASELAMVPAP